MREIKFRGYDVSLNLWRYGSLRMMKGGCEISWFNDDGIYFSRFVKPETVGQYIGLADDKLDIYEGDIVVCRKNRHDPKLTGVIDFDEGSFILRKVNSWRYSINDTFERSVIGNIYENKDLLEGTESA